MVSDIEMFVSFGAVNGLLCNVTGGKMAVNFCEASNSMPVIYLFTYLYYFFLCGVVIVHMFEILFLINETLNK